LGKVSFSDDNIQVIPEFPFWYQRVEKSLMLENDHFLNRNIRPYLEILPEQLKDIILLARGFFMIIIPKGSSLSNLWKDKSLTKNQ